MKSTDLDKASSVTQADYAMVQSSSGTQPALVPVSDISPSGFDPNRVRELFMGQVYPIGSYIETDGSDPSSTLGGTWQQVFGKFLFATKSGYAYTDTAQIPADSGKTIQLKVANLPSHYHAMTYSHNHTPMTAQSHTHPYTHSHTSPSYGAHTHGFSSHSHADGNHTHTISSGLGTISGAGATKTSTFGDRLMVTDTANKIAGDLTMGSSSAGLYTTSSTTASSNLISGTYGANSSTYSQACKENSTAVESASTGGSNTTSSSSGTLSGYCSNNTGGSGYHENMPPYYATNIWKRVA